MLQVYCLGWFNQKNFRGTYFSTAGRLNTTISAVFEAHSTQYNIE